MDLKTIQRTVVIVATGETLPVLNFSLLRSLGVIKADWGEPQDAIQLPQVGQLNFPKFLDLVFMPERASFVDKTFRKEPKNSPLYASALAFLDASGGTGLSACGVNSVVLIPSATPLQTMKTKLVALKPWERIGVELAGLTATFSFKFGDVTASVAFACGIAAKEDGSAATEGLLASFNFHLPVAERKDAAEICRKHIETGIEWETKGREILQTGFPELLQ